MAINDVVKKLITEVKYVYNLNQSDIADKLGIKATYLSDVINGRVSFSDNLKDNLRNNFPAVFSIEHEENSIKEIRDRLGLSQTDFAKKIGASLRTVQNYEAGGVVPESKYEILRTIGTVDNLPTINYNGKGVPYYNVDFIGGFDIVLGDQTVNPECYINFPVYDKADMWVNITGKSMEPLINHGDMIAMRKVEDWNTYMLYGEIYGIVTDEYRTVKKIRSSSKGGDYLRLVPLNCEFDEQDIPKSIIRGVFQVVGCAKRIF